MKINRVDEQYFKLINKILKDGVVKGDRTGTGTKSIFDYTMRFNMSDGFPILTSKKVHFKGVLTELIWFLKGDTNIKYLVDNGVHIWDGDAYKNYVNNFKPTQPSPELDVQSDFREPLSKETFIKIIESNSHPEFTKKWGELGPVYGKQWRGWSKYDKSTTNDLDSEYHSSWDGPIDQIQNLIDDLKSNPDSRRLIVSAWNVGDLDKMVLPPCHYGFQCYTQEMDIEERVLRWCNSIKKHISFGEDITHEKLDSLRFPKRKLSLKWTQRSCDVPLGIPYNIVSYAILLHLLSQEVNMIPDDLIFSGGDCHIYLNQIDGIKKQLTQETFKLPHIEISKKSIFDISQNDVNLIDYKSSLAVRMPLSN